MSARLSDKNFALACAGMDRFHEAQAEVRREAERARASEADLAGALEKAVQRCGCAIFCDKCAADLALVDRAEP